MKLYPEYSENIIVYLILDNVSNWYVTEKEYWFLDRIAYAQAFNVQPTMDDIEFTNLLVEGNPSKLISDINSFKVDILALRELIEIYPPLNEDQSLLEMRPSLYINFDKKELYSLFPEPSGEFERFAPKGWTAKYDSFYSKIPNEDTFWLKNGTNLFSI